MQTVCRCATYESLWLSSPESFAHGKPPLLSGTYFGNVEFVEMMEIVAAVRSEFRGPDKREEEKQQNQLLGVASASIGFNAVLLMSVTKPALLSVPPRKNSPYDWLSLPLLAVWGAILLNAFVQFRILERLTVSRRRGSSGAGGTALDVTLNQRVAELEENVREFLITARGLSKQVEKLGVRFRATKRTLRDPMQETAAIAQKTSEVATILAQREDRLEEELRGLQLSLLAMQEHQVKQLSLISLALKRTKKNDNDNSNSIEAQATKTLSSSVNGVQGSGSQTAADTHARGPPAQVVASPKKSVGNGATSINGPSSTFSSESSLSKIDFWKDSVTSSAVVEKMSNSPPGTMTKALDADSESSVLVAPEAAEYVEQPDYDSDSWLR